MAGWADCMNLASIDLNLLKAFDAIMAERRVTRAAARIGLTQPAMSNALSRLRLLFKDQLFIRTNEGMRPTSRALQLAGPIQRALRSIEEAIASSTSFDHKTAQRDFSIGMTDFSGVALAMALAEKAQAAAPGIRIQIRYVDRQAAFRLLETELVDVVVGVYLAAQPEFEAAFLFNETTTFLMRKGHPASRKFSLAKVLAYPHLLASPLGAKTGTIDPILAELGLKRQIHVVVPDLIAVPWLLRSSDLVTAVAMSTAKRLAKLGGLHIVSAPEEMQRSNQVMMLWHERDNGDPAKAWLRRTLRELAGAGAAGIRAPAKH
jgi:DNA-binding transcriptional LysR family regulator